MSKQIKGNLKIMVIGNSFSGKTSFTQRWVRGHFSNTYKSTIMSELGSKDIRKDNNVYTVHLWDLAGQDKTIYLSSLFCRDSHGAIVLCDATDNSSLSDTAKWKATVFNSTKFEDGTELPVILVQNKIDLLSEEDEIQTEEKIKKFSEDNSFLHYFRTSAKTGRGINECMDYLIDLIIDKVKNMDTTLKKKPSANNKSSHLNLNKKEEKKSKNSCCM